MKRAYLVVFEKVAEDNWGAFAPDVPNTGGVGETMQEARQSLREGIGYVLDDCVERGCPFPEATSTSVDFSEFDPNPEQSHYEIEWLSVELPQLAEPEPQKAQYAA